MKIVKILGTRKFGLYINCLQVWDTEIAPKILRLLKHTNMTIHWKALEEHFLIEPLVFHFNHFWKNAFSEFFSKKSVLKQLHKLNYDFFFY
jgi:hypothetical protein